MQNFPIASRSKKSAEKLWWGVAAIAGTGVMGYILLRPEYREPLIDPKYEKAWQEKNEKKRREEKEAAQKKEREPLMPPATSPPLSKSTAQRGRENAVPPKVVCSVADVDPPMLIEGGEGQAIGPLSWFSLNGEGETSPPNTSTQPLQAVGQQQEATGARRPRPTRL